MSSRGPEQRSAPAKSPSSPSAPALPAPCPAAQRAIAAAKSSQPDILYWGGRLILNQRLVAIYYSPTTIFNNGPTPGEVGTGANDHSLVGYFLSHIGGSSYWNINSLYYQIVGGQKQFVQNTMSYDS